VNEKFEEKVAISYKEVLERATELLNVMKGADSVLPPASVPMPELRRTLLRDVAALTVARHLTVNQLEQLGVPRHDALQYGGELAMASLKKVTEAEKTPSIIQ
jgi:hypothetical protein